MNRRDALTTMAATVAGACLPAGAKVEEPGRYPIHMYDLSEGSWYMIVSEDNAVIRDRTFDRQTLVVSGSNCTVLNCKFLDDPYSGRIRLVMTGDNPSCEGCLFDGCGARMGHFGIGTDNLK